MAEHKEQQSAQAMKGVGGSDPRQHNQTSTGRGESASARDESSRGIAQGSTGSGRMSNESDRVGHRGESAGRPGHPAQPDEMPLKLGSNGGGRNDDQPAGSDSARPPRGTESHSEQRKAS
jgi:hypothetical protein